jgi:hypothetical protein
MNDENILIIGDDGAGEPINSSNAAPEKTSAGDESWLGGRTDAVAENFLRKHKTEFQEFERREREKLACAEQYRALEAEIINRRQWLEGLKSDISAYHNIDLATDLYKNMQLTGRPLLEIAQNPLFAAAALIKEHGKSVLKLAEKDLGDLEEKFETFKAEKGEILKELAV